MDKYEIYTRSFLSLDEQKTELNNESVLQSKLDQSSNNQIQQQTSLTKSLRPSPPEIQFKQNYQFKEKYPIEQNTMEKNISTNIEQNTEKFTQQKPMIQYPFNINKITDYYGKSSQPLIQMFFDTIELQKDYVNAFRPLCVEHMKTNVENYLGFQDKMMSLCLDTFGIYLKNILDSTIKIKK